MNRAVDAALLLRYARLVQALHGRPGRHSNGACPALACSSGQWPCVPWCWARLAEDAARGVSWVRRWTAWHDGRSLGLLPPLPAGIGDGDVLALRRPNPYTDPDEPWLWSNDPDETQRLPAVAGAR